jgi:hypothetical protein
MVTTGGGADLSEFQATLRVYAEVVWSSLFLAKASWSRHNIVERNPPAQENTQRGEG